VCAVPLPQTTVRLFFNLVPRFFAPAQAEAEEEVVTGGSSGGTASGSGGGGSSGGAVPFEFEAEATAALKAFAAGERRAVEIMIHPKKEICQLGALAGDTEQGDLEAGVVPDEPRFYLLNYGGHKVFACVRAS
jgi:hypothetical protein